MKNEIAEQSLQELAKIARFFNIHGMYPIVIGGWAAYYYIKGPKSIDIDIVLPSAHALKVFGGYSVKGGFEKDKFVKARTAFKKKVKINGQTGEIIIDFFTFSDRNLLAADRNIEIPWKLSETNASKWELGKDAIALVPEKELLILYKAAALIDRQFKLKTWANLSKPDRDRLNSKIEKDKNDLEGLIASGIDREKLQDLLERTGFKDYFRSAAGAILPGGNL